MVSEASSVSVYQCADGTDFPVRWEDPAHAVFTFFRDASHWPSAWKPLAAAVERLFIAGGQDTFTESGVPAPPFFQPRLMVNGFMYLRRTPATAEEMAARERAARRLTAQFGGPLSFWEGYCLPRIREVCAWLQGAADTTPLELLARRAGYAWAHTHIHALMYNVQALAGFLSGYDGAEAELLTNELMQGYPNTTIDIHQALWQIAQQVRATPGAERVLRGTPLEQLRPALAAAGAHAVTAAVDGLLERYGWRADGWELSSPAWRERPETPLGLIRAMVLNDSPEPAALTRQGAERREQTAQKVMQRLPSAAERERFRELLAAVANYVAIREDRALWQQTVTGSLRGALLRHGERLVREQHLDAVEDIFFLLPEEVERPPAHVKDLIEQRRRDWQGWAARTPPATIGAGATTPPAVATPAAAPGTVAIKGIPASRGVHTGRARVILDPYEGDRLAPGEVLVCVMTTPTWTPLFAVAGAIVTDTGMAGSHPAITAREFGIPAVVGAAGATTRIPDGAMVTVDGVAGTVEVQG